MNCNEGWRIPWHVQYNSAYVFNFYLSLQRTVSTKTITTTSRYNTDERAYMFWILGGFTFSGWLLATLSMIYTRFKCKNCNRSFLFYHLTKWRQKWNTEHVHVNVRIYIIIQCFLLVLKTLLKILWTHKNLNVQY